MERAPPHGRPFLMGKFFRVGDVRYTRVMKRTVLIVAVLLGIIGLGAGGLYTVFFETKETSSAVSTVDDSYTVDELFELGEYYFNHTDTPGGAYDLALARDYYQAAIRKDPQGHPAVWYQLGRIDFIEGDFEGALYKFERQREYFPDSEINVDYMVGLTYGYKARRTNDPADWERGAEAFANFVEFEPAAPWPRVDLAWIYFAQGKYEEMKPVLAEGLIYDSNNAWLHNMYGLALLNTDDLEGAREHFVFARELAADLTPEDWGKSYPGNNPGDWEQGLREFQEAILKNIALTEV